ncbi:MAG: hypothetical protein IJU50_04625 [Lachnospiraceae bacterium]|nr:hypothetical protein [Lachnospiraceae bacterium]
MYKKQMKLQNVLCMLAIFSSVLVFLYALGIMTDLYDTLYSTMRNPADLTQTDVPGSIVYYNMQTFDSVFLKYSIALILLACLLYITNTHIRRKYYIGNYVSIGLFAAAHIYTAVWAHGYIEAYKVRFLRVDFAALKEHAELWKTAYTESTFWFDIHYLVFAVTVLVSIGLVASAVWKWKLMKEEDALLRRGKGASA